MTEIQGKSILVRVSARFELVRVRIIGSGLYNHAALCYGRTKLSRNQSWVNLLFSVLDPPLDSRQFVTDSRFSIRTGIEYCRFGQAKLRSNNTMPLPTFANQGKIKNATPSAENQTCIISDSICLILRKLKNMLILKQSGLSGIKVLIGKVAGLVIYLTDPPIFVLFDSFSKSE